MSATVPLNLGLLKMMDRLGGQKANRLPELLEGIQPVVVYSDLSNSIASEIFEARGMLSFTTSAIGVPGFWSGLELVSRAAGGILIDRITCRQTVDDQGVTVAVNPFTSFTAGPVVPIIILDCGGAAASGTASINGQIVALPANAVQIYTDVGIVQDLAIPRIYVPPGHFFLMSTTNTNVRIDATITWRELADVQGG